MIGQIRIVGTDQVFEIGPLSCDDEVLQIDRTVESAVVIHNIDRRDIVVVSGLPDQFMHGLADGKTFFDLDIIRRHVAADLVVFIRQDHTDIFFVVVIQHTDQFFLDRLVQIFQDIGSVIGVHFVDDLDGTLQTEFFQILVGIFDIGEDLGCVFRTEQRIDLFAFFRCQKYPGIGDIILMIVRQSAQQFFFRKIAAEYIQQFGNIVLFFDRFFFHRTPPSSMHTAYI